MIRQTSIEAYNALRLSGDLGAKQWMVYSVLYHDGPLTANEVAEKLCLNGFTKNKPSLTPRFAELAAMQVIQVVGTRLCKVSGRKCRTWDVTNSTKVFPVAPKITRKQLEDKLWRAEKSASDILTVKDAEIERLKQEFQRDMKQERQRILDLTLENGHLTDKLQAIRAKYAEIDF